MQGPRNDTGEYLPTEYADSAHQVKTSRVHWRRLGCSDVLRILTASIAPNAFGLGPAGRLIVIGLDNATRLLLIGARWVVAG
jgi:hypothetical protein